MTILRAWWHLEDEAGRFESLKPTRTTIPVLGRQRQKKEKEREGSREGRRGGGKEGRKVG